MQQPNEHQIRQLIDEAKRASSLAYCPYSNYPVGAAILSFDGQIYSGCNVENCGYTQTIHAEQTAMARAISEGALERARTAGLSQLEFISAIAVHAQKGKDPWPCCNCRQSLNEFGLEMLIVGEGADGSVAGKQLKELIPHAFDMELVLASVGEAMNEPAGLSKTVSKTDTTEVSPGAPEAPGDERWRRLVDSAREASLRAYCPYSRYPVGAAILSFDGQIYSGCNVENCSYTQTIHAEQAALTKAVSSGALQRALESGLTQSDFIDSIAIYSPKGTEPWPSCNGRQSLNEFGLKMNIVGECADGKIVSKKLEELIPFAFPMEIVLASGRGEH